MTDKRAQELSTEVNRLIWKEKLSTWEWWRLRILSRRLWFYNKIRRRNGK